VRVSNMSAFPGEPAHLSEWLYRRQGAFVAADQFVTRETYGEYIGSLLEAEAGREGARRLLLLRDEAQALERTLLGVDLELASGSRLSARAAVLAIGPLPARPMFPVLAELPPALYAPDPWDPAAVADVDPHGLVVLVGAGLTMVDVALALYDQGHRGPILALSRRGLAPLTHAPVAPARGAAPVPELVGVAALLRRVRGRAQEVGWRQAVDELRPFTQALWRGATLEQKRRFLRHLRPWWDSHRHRMAPGVARRIEDMRAARQLSVCAGRIVAAEAREGRALLTWRPRGERLTRSLEAVRIVDCTGFNAFDLDRGHARSRARRRRGVSSDRPRRRRRQGPAGGRAADPRRVLGDHRRSGHPKPGRVDGGRPRRGARAPGCAQPGSASRGTSGLGRRSHNAAAQITLT
jgi:uncharacterized NAD(P)/FAD-binding protein YdhS